MRISDWSSDVCSSDLLSSNILHQTAIKFRPPITEKAHSRAVFARAVQIERCYQCSRFLRTGFGNEVAPFISDEAVTVEDLPILLANTVGGDDRHDVRHGVAQHGAAPHPAGVQIGLIGLRSYGRWKEKHFRSKDRREYRSFRIPPVPAYADANSPAGRETGTGKGV